MCVVCARVRACVRAYVCVCVCVCVLQGFGFRPTHEIDTEGLEFRVQSFGLRACGLGA